MTGRTQGYHQAMIDLLSSSLKHCSDRPHSPVRVLILFKSLTYHSSSRNRGLMQGALNM
jgi:hypothetical protein